MNIYVASQNDLAACDKIGPQTAKRIIQLRDEVLSGAQAPLTVKELAAVRLSEEQWQAMIDDGIISIDLPEASAEKEVTDGASVGTLTQQNLMDLFKSMKEANESLRLPFNMRPCKE